MKPTPFRWNDTDKFLQKQCLRGLPWWCSGSELPANSGGTGTKPGPGRPHTTRDNKALAPQRLSPHSRAHKRQILSPRAATTKACSALRLVSPNYWACAPQLLKPACPSVCLLWLQNNRGAATAEACVAAACAPRQKKSPQGLALAPQLESNPHSLQLEEARAQQQRPGTDNNNK